MTPFFDQNGVTLYQGDCRDVLRALPERSVNCCVTSPPYYGLRSYMPNAVRLRNDLVPEKRKEIEDQLRKIGVFPVDHTSK